jgi:hypothetical protein
LLRFGVYNINSSVVEIGRVEIDEAGTVTIAGGGNDMLALSGISFAATSADAVSPE